MARLRTPVALLFLGTGLFAPHAHAQYVGDTTALGVISVAALAGVGYGTFYVVGGTLTFAILDATQLARGEPFSPEFSWVQAAYGSSLLGIGALAASLNAPSQMTVPVLVAGSAFVLIPLAEWAFRAPSDPSLVTVRFSPSGVHLDGRF